MGVRRWALQPITPPSDHQPSISYLLAKPRAVAVSAPATRITVAGVDRLEARREILRAAMRYIWQARAAVQIAVRRSKYLGYSAALELAALAGQVLETAAEDSRVRECAVERARQCFTSQCT